MSDSDNTTYIEKSSKSSSSLHDSIDSDNKFHVRVNFSEGKEQDSDSEDMDAGDTEYQSLWQPGSSLMNPESSLMKPEKVDINKNPSFVSMIHRHIWQGSIYR